MPTISVQQDLLRHLLSQHGLKHDVEVMGDQLPLMGTDIDRCDNEALDIEIFPDRPDLLSGETLAHAIRPFLHGTTATPDMEVTESGITVEVDARLSEIRPVILGAIVKGVNIHGGEGEMEAFIKSLMDHQEKLHFALGRGRKRASIGVHDMSSLQAPFRVVAAPGTSEFIPLGESSPMTIDTILEQHPKGVDYAHLLKDMESYPLILDARDAVLSFPPIINGQHTTVHHGTKEFFIDVTGWDERACEAALMLVCLQLQERGGSVYSVEITTCHGDTIRSPVGEGVIHHVPEELVVNLLGRSFTDEELQLAINRMGGRFNGKNPAPSDAPSKAEKMSQASSGKALLEFTMPRWRFDLLHPVDMVEEIAIGHGYEDLGEDSPKAQLTAQPRSDHNIRRRLRESMQGMGLMSIPLKRWLISIRFLSGGPVLLL